MENVQNKTKELDGASGSTSRGIECMKRLEQATNRHDLNALTECFDADYQSEFPAHPDRAFRGHEPMRKNWTQIFASVPDMHTSLVRAVEDGETVWTEWEWTGTRVDKQPFHFRGVTIQTIPEDRITRAWLYMEPVQVGGPGPDATIRKSVAG